jgi:hypothetical protein
MDPWGMSNRNSMFHQNDEDFHGDSMIDLAAMAGRRESKTSSVQ